VFFCVLTKLKKIIEEAGDIDKIGRENITLKQEIPVNLRIIKTKLNQTSLTGKL
jgi:hypothetical protein